MWPLSQAPAIRLNDGPASRPGAAGKLAQIFFLRSCANRFCCGVRMVTVLFVFGFVLPVYTPLAAGSLDPRGRNIR